jgi:hypothetical protein
LDDDQVTNADVVAWDGEVAIRGRWGAWGCGDHLCSFRSSNVLNGLTRQGIGFAGLGVVRSWVESGIQLGTEVLQVAVVVFRRHFLVFLFFLDDDDLRDAATRFLFRDRDVYLFNVNWLRALFRGNVELWSRNETTN